MAFPDPKTPTRNQLFKVLQNHDLVRLFEKLFEVAGNLTPIEIEAIYILIQELSDELNSHIGDPIDAHGASAISNDPAGNIVATDVQDAINELDEQIGSAIEYTGLVQHEGGVVTLNTDITKIDITGCSYWLSGVLYTYAGDTALIPTIGAGDSSFFVGLDSTGLMYSGTTWTDAQKETIIPLCRLQAVQGQSGPGSDLQPPIDQRYIIGEEGYHRRLWHEQTIGVLYYQGGEIYESTTPLQVSENAGTFFTAQAVPKTISAATDLQALQLNHVSGVWSLGTKATIVTPKFYDDGTDLVALANNKWASHTLLRAPKEDDSFILVISPAQYQSEADAQAAGIYYGLFQNQALSGLYPVCHLLVKGSSTNVTIHDHRPVIGETSGGIIGTATLQQTYDNSATPEILTDTTRGALSLKRGTAADTDAVVEVLNGAGAQTWHVLGNGDMVSPKAAGRGIRVDNAAPTFGWRDLEGYEIPDPTGGDRPTLSVYSGGSIKENAFSNGDVLRIRYHVPHDYVKDTDMFAHIHWSHNGTAISGNVVFGLTSDYAKGHNQGEFGNEKTINITYSTIDISTTPQYRHRIEESAITSDGGSATLIDRELLEPDGIILVTFELITNPTITGGSPNNVFVHRADLHYQSTNIATKDKAPDFYN